MKTALIFGITGQDGYHLTDLLLKKNYKVYGVARRTSQPNDHNLVEFKDNPSFVLLRGDVTDPFSVRKVIEDVFYDLMYPDGLCGGRTWQDSLEIYNLAAQSHVKTSFDEPLYTTQVSYLGCLNILETLRQFEVLKQGCKFYQASSSEMFGSSWSYLSTELGRQHGSGLADLGGVVKTYDGYGNVCGTANLNNCAFQSEETPMFPRSPYAIAKLAAYHAVRLYREAYGIFACNGILFNHEGEKRGAEFVTQKIARYVAALSKNKTLPPLRLGNLNAMRDWGYAGDYVEAMWAMLQTAKPDDYVVATGETHSVEDFLKEAFSVIGVDNYWDYVVVDEAFKRPAEVDYLRGNAGKAKRVLGWSPKTDFKTLVKRMVLANEPRLE